MDLGKYYNKKALDYGISKVREKKIFDFLPKKLKGTKVLDVGCAAGYLGQKLKKRGAEVYGLDVSKNAVKIARKVIDDAKLVDLNTQKIPYLQNTFDIIIASEILEHLINPKFSLKEFKRVLKNSGFLIITTPNITYWGNRIKFIKGQFAYEKSGMFDEGHIHFYTYETLRYDLKNSNFKLVKENHIFPGSKVLTLFKKHFPGVFAYQFIVKCIK